jgi:hypothetical protein
MDAGDVAMKRSIGVTLSAVVTILGSVLTALFGVLMLVNSTVQWGGDPDEPPYVRVAGFVMAGVMFALTAWGVTTAIGLIRLRRWARVCILVFSVFMAFCFGSAAVVMAFVPLPSPPNAPPGLMTGVRIGIVCVYGLLTLIGGWWLYLFNRASVVAQFAPGPPPARPLSVSMIAWLLLFGGVACFVNTWLPFPAMLFGFMITGWSAKAAYLVLSLLQLWLGVGLLRLRPLSRVLTIGFFALGALNGVSMAFLPGAAARMMEAMAALPASMRQPPSADFPLPLAVIAVTTVFTCSVPIWFLVRSRVAFLKAPPTQ